jgi:hypothetical protein
MKFALAMIAAGGAVGAASHASANTLTTTTLNIDPSTNPVVDINLAGAANAQYTYGYTAPFTFKGNSFGDDTKLLGIPSAQIGAQASFGDHPLARVSPTSTEFKTVEHGTVQVAAPGGSGADFFLHLQFQDDSGNNYVGTADFAGNATLKSITYGAVPEPEAWALLVGGLGLAGGALRRRRRDRAQPAMA